MERSRTILHLKPQPGAQPVTPSLAKLSRVCAQPCTTCTPFVDDDDDIEWKTDPFEMRPESANPETPDEIIAMITFAGWPELQEQLRSLCREYIDIFSTSVRSLLVQVDPMVIEIDRTKWEVPLDTILLKSKQPSAHRSTNYWSSASSRNLRPASGAKLTPYPRATVNGD